MPAQAPAASLPITESSPSFLLKSFCIFNRKYESYFLIVTVVIANIITPLIFSCKWLPHHLVGVISNKLDGTIRYDSHHLEQQKDIFFY